MVAKHYLPNDPSWLKKAFSDLGVQEIVGPLHNDKVLEMYRMSGHPEIQDDETAWCAAAVGSWLQAAGIRGTNSLMARSYATYGTKLDRNETIPRGAICVWPRGAPPSGHVDLCLDDDGVYITCLGGNVGNAVEIYRQPKSQMIAAVWPKGKPIAKPVAVVDQEWQPDDPGAEHDTKKTIPWWKKVKNWVTGGGAATAASGIAGSIYDYRVAIVFAGLIVVLAILGMIWWKWFRK